MRQNAFDDGLRQDPLGELECSPRPPSRNTGGGMPTSKREGKEWNGKREGRDGKEKGRKGRGRADPRPGLGKCKGGNPTCSRQVTS